MTSVYPVLARVALAACMIAALPQAASAQSLDELDRLVMASSKPAGGLALARSQMAAGAWLDALATLERVLAADPKHKQVRLAHAEILCRIDDLEGASVEFARLKSRDYKKAEWSAATAPCKPIAGGAK